MEGNENEKKIVMRDEGGGHLHNIYLWWSIGFCGGGIGGRGRENN
jgi:hypothetical protein